METISIKIDENMNLLSVKDVLTDRLELSKNSIKKLKFEGSITVDGKDVTVRYILKKGELLRLEFPCQISENIKPALLAIDIIYEDDYILAVNKPSGMATHPSFHNREDTLANAVMAYYGGNFTFRVITRLDKYTSGVVIIAKSAMSAAKLSDLMKKGGFLKTYKAVVCGVPENEAGEINEPIARCGDSIIKREISPDGKPAVTYYKVTDKKEDKCMVSVNIQTGRTHQIRLHMAHIGHPVWGDFLYGKEIPDERCCLHCETVEFLNPLTNENLKLYAPVREDMKKVFNS